VKGLTELWERRADETDKAFRAFVVYRDMGTGRAIDRIPQFILGPTGAPLYKSVRYFRVWSSQYNWVERVRAYDAHLDDVRRKATEDEIRKEREDMRKTHRTIARAMQDRIIAKLMPDPKDRSTYLPVKDIKPGQIPAWVKIATDLERLTMDMPTIMISDAGEQGIDKYAEAKWLDEYNKLMAEYGLIPDTGTKKDNGRDGQAEDDKVHPDNPDP